MNTDPSKKISKAKIEVLAGLERLEAPDEIWQESAARSSALHASD